MISRADTLTPDECHEFKREILREIELHKINIYQFPDGADDDEGELPAIGEAADGESERHDERPHLASSGEQAAQHGGETAAGRGEVRRPSHQEDDDANAEEGAKEGEVDLRLHSAAACVRRGSDVMPRALLPPRVAGGGSEVVEGEAEDGDDTERNSAQRLWVTVVQVEQSGLFQALARVGT